MLEITNKSSHYQFIEATARMAGAELRNRFCRKLQISAKPDRSIVTDADLASEKILLSEIRKKWPDDLILSEEAGAPLGNAAPGQYVWIVDPLDGTSNFVNGYPFFSVSIARCLVLPDGAIQQLAGAVYDVNRDVLYFAERGLGAFANDHRLAISQKREFAEAFLVTGFYYQTGSDLEREIRRFEKVAAKGPTIRRDGSAALDLALVASGVFDAFWESGLQPWDVAAGVLLVREAGGIVRNYPESTSGPYDMYKTGLVAGEPSAVNHISDLLSP